MDELSETVVSALASVKHIPRERILPETLLQDLGLDSLDKITLLFELEKQLQLAIPDDELRSIRSVQDIIEGISRLRASAAVPSAPAECNS